MENLKIKTYKTQIDKIVTGEVINTYVTLDEAISIVQEALIKDRKKNFDEEDERDNLKNSSKNEKNTYEIYLKEKKEYLDVVGDILLRTNLHVRDMSTERLRDTIANEIGGFSVIGPLIEDGEVSDIYLNAYNQIFYRKHDRNHTFESSFRDVEHYENFIERIVSKAGTNLDNSSNRILDFQLYGFRFNALNNSIATRGTCMTIRKSTSHELTINDILRSGLINKDMMDLIGAMLTGKLSFMFAGGTGSGKTTSVKAFINEYFTKLNRRLVIAEDTAEVFVTNPNTLNLLTYKSKENPTDLEDLLKVCLRQRPDCICIGEVRGKEAETCIEACETGHPVIFTLHANRAINAINRLVTKYLQQMPSLTSDVVERIVANSIDYIIIQAEIAGVGRRVKEITEVSFDEDLKRIELTPIFKYDLFEDEFVACNNISKLKAEIMIENGVEKKIVNKLLNLK